MFEVFVCGFEFRLRVEYGHRYGFGFENAMLNEHGFYVDLRYVGFWVCRAKNFLGVAHRNTIAAMLENLRIAFEPLLGACGLMLDFDKVLNVFDVGHGHDMPVIHKLVYDVELVRAGVLLE